MRPKDSRLNVVVVVEAPVAPAANAVVVASRFRPSPLLIHARSLAIGCSGNRKPAAPPTLGAPVERGMASWHGPKFNGKRTASGERYE